MPARSTPARWPDSPTRASCTTSSAALRARSFTRCDSGVCTSARSSVPAAYLAPEAGEWIADDRALTTAVENALAAELALAAGRAAARLSDEDADARTRPPRAATRTAKCKRLTAEGWKGAINLPKLSEEFYRSARWLRVYTSPRIAVDPHAVVRLANRSADEVRERIKAGMPVLDWK